jgi:hypothetical protein
MARFRLRTLRRALTPTRPATPPVHFHNGPQGQPSACFDASCGRPRLDVG